jgi:hypothetical protein
MANYNASRTQKASMSTGSPKISLQTALAKIDNKFRERIISAYLELKRRYSEARYSAAWDVSGLSAGKFCEAVFRYLQYELTGSSIPFGTHITNFTDECRKLITLPVSTGNESLRIIIPRALVFLYTLRGKRGIGHVGGDVEANQIDAETVVRTCDWVICELIRIYHNLSLEDAQGLVDAIAVRTIPDVWEVAGKKRVLRTDLSFKDKVLLLLYSDPQSGALVEDLCKWTDHSNFTVFKRNVIQQLHRELSVEYDQDSEIVYISPLGTKRVEGHILAQNKQFAG